MPEQQLPAVARQGLLSAANGVRQGRARGVGAERNGGPQLHAVRGWLRAKLVGSSHNKLHGGSI